MRVSSGTALTLLFLSSSCSCGKVETTKRVVARVERPIATEVVETATRSPAYRPIFSATVVVHKTPQIEFPLSEGTSGAPYDGVELVMDDQGERIGYRIFKTYPWSIAYLTPHGDVLFYEIPQVLVDPVTGSYNMGPPGPLDWNKVPKLNWDFALQLASDGNKEFMRNDFATLLRAGAGDDPKKTVDFLNATFEKAMAMDPVGKKSTWDDAFKKLLPAQQELLQARMKKALRDGGDDPVILRAMAHADLGDKALGPSLVKLLESRMGVDPQRVEFQRGQIIVGLLTAIARQKRPEAGEMACTLWKSTDDALVHGSAASILKAIGAKCPEAQNHPSWNNVEPAKL